LNLLPYRGIFSTAITILDKKRRPVPAKFGPLDTPHFCSAAVAAALQKQSINHAGKETNALRYGPAATSFWFLGAAMRAFAPQVRSCSS
jgi:hypothetical protein